MTREIETVDELIAYANEKGSPFFSPGTMKFFRSRVQTGIISGKYFVTSEKNGDERRMYTLRQFTIAGDGSIRFDTVGDFGAWRTADRARREAWTHALGWVSTPAGGE